ncbi:MAG TPA: hypothetical protein VIJ57_13580 [Hanamia sp.]
MFVKVKGAIGRKELQTAMVAPFVINLSMTANILQCYLPLIHCRTSKKEGTLCWGVSKKEGHLSKGKVRLLHEQNDLSEPYPFSGRCNCWQGHRLNARAKTPTGVR